MFSMKLSQGLALLLAVVGFGFSAPDAHAGGCGSGYSYSYYGGHHGRNVSIGYHGPNFRFHVGVGRNYHRSYSYCDTPRVNYYSHRSSYRSSYPTYRSTHRNVTYHQPSYQRGGYWRQVWVPPVYNTRYDCHGYPYRVQVSAGYYDRVWVH
ncbi:MAG: hypothetical protein AAGC44_15755 [Planctomycetota bacterium]